MNRLKVALNIKIQQGKVFLHPLRTKTLRLLRILRQSFLSLWKKTLLYLIFNMKLHFLLPTFKPYYEKSYDSFVKVLKELWDIEAHRKKRGWDK